MGVTFYLEVGSVKILHLASREDGIIAAEEASLGYQNLGLNLSAPYDTKYHTPPGILSCHASFGAPGEGVYVWKRWSRSIERLGSALSPATTRSMPPKHRPRASNQGQGKY